jgi:hypothetical protein
VRKYLAIKIECIGGIPEQWDKPQLDSLRRVAQRRELHPGEVAEEFSSKNDTPRAQGERIENRNLEE